MSTGRRARWFRVAAVALVAGSSLVVAACGDDDAPSATPGPAVADVLPAVEALEAELGGPQEYFEINADRRLVNLFVATDDGTTFTPYLYLDGELQPPAPAQPASSGVTFVAEDLTFDPVRVLERVADELPNSAIERFVVLVGPEGSLRHEVFVRSTQGGQLAVLVDGNGEVLGVETL